MEYEQAISQLFALSSRGIRLGVQRMEDALRYRDAPERGQRFVQIAGTNGKGSVACMVATVLNRAGYRTGLFTSPHLHRWVERIRVDGRPLGEREAGRRIGEVLRAFARPGAPEVTFFELTTLIALEVFRDRRCDVAVLETGLGGRLDATTATTPLVGAITRVALDHTRLLGHTVEDIAREKAGIIKPGVPIVVGAKAAAAQRVILQHAAQLGAPARLIDRDFAVLPEPAGGFSVRVAERRFEGLRLSLPGLHQQANAACALAVLSELEVCSDLRCTEAAPAGLRATRWAGRMEVVARRPRVLLDAAHNADGCRALSDFVSEQPVAGRRILLFGTMRDKDYPAMLRILSPVFDEILYSPPDIHRATPYAALNRVRPGRRTSDLTGALHAARDLAGEDGLVVVAGSIFLVAAARAHLLGVRSDPPIRM